MERVIIISILQACLIAALGCASHNNDESTNASNIPGNDDNWELKKIEVTEWNKQFLQPIEKEIPPWDCPPLPLDSKNIIESAGHDIVTEECPKVAKSCSEFISRNYGRSGLTVGSPLIAHSVEEEHLFITSIPCDTGGYYSSEIQVEYIEDLSIDELSAFCSKNSSDTITLFFDVSSFFRKEDCINE